MELPKISDTASGVLSGIKSKLGFSNESQDDYEDDYYYDGDYEDDYDEGYDDLDEYDDEYEDEDYRDEGRSSRGSFERLRSRASFAGGRKASQPRQASSSVRSVSSNLVNIDDVRSRTRVPESLTRDPLGDMPSRASADREPIPRYAAGQASFDSFTPAAADASAAGFEPARSGFDPYDAYSGEGETAHAPSRSVSVLRPASYAEVEQVARCLRAGDMVVLNLKNTSGDLAKRILDFSFGAASMIDARVECVGEKVFALSTGVALTDDEKARLISQGVM